MSAVAERFLEPLKRERMTRRVYAILTRPVRISSTNHIEIFHNRIRKQA